MFRILKLRLKFETLDLQYNKEIETFINGKFSKTT